MVSWNRNQQVNVFIGNKRLSSFNQVKRANKIKLRSEFLEHFQQTASFVHELRGKSNVMFTVDVYDMQSWFEKIQYFFYRRIRNAFIFFIEI